MTSYLVIHLHHRLCHTIFGNIGLIMEQNIQCHTRDTSQLQKHWQAGKSSKVNYYCISFVIAYIEIVAQDFFLQWAVPQIRTKIQDRL